MVASMVYVALRRVLAVVVLRLRSREFKELEIVVLRHELEILRRRWVGRGCVARTAPSSPRLVVFCLGAIGAHCS